jgi:metallo-beta-lactamase class B
MAKDYPESKNVTSANIRVEPTTATPVALTNDYKPIIDTINPGQPVEPRLFTRTAITSIKPIKLFDNFYFVGTTSVGSFVIDTGAGLIMLDTGGGVADSPSGKPDTALMVDDMKTLGLDPGNIKLILISHEHVDHYGGVPYLKKNVCPDAKVALSLIGWNNLMIRPNELGWSDPRPTSADIFLSDRQNIILGNTTIECIYTPGHSDGCMSFIIPVTDNKTPHVVGIMGGNSVQPSWDLGVLYYQSVEYFMGFTRQAKCDIGLGVHAQAYFKAFEKLRIHKQGDPNPLVIGTEKFETEYLQQFMDMALTRLKSLPADNRIIPRTIPGASLRPGASPIK